MHLTLNQLLVSVCAAWCGLTMASAVAGSPGPCGADNQLPASMGGGCALPDQQAVPPGAGRFVDPQNPQEGFR